MDEDDTPQRFPLQRLLRRVYEVAGAGVTTCNLSKVRVGYGLRIRELDEQLGPEEVVTISLSELDALSAGTEEWFYDLEARVPGTDIRFGLHDTTALFVETESPIIEEILRVFRTYRRAT